MSEARPLRRTNRIIVGVFMALMVVVAVGTIRLAFYGDQQKSEKQVAQAGQAAEQAEKKTLASQVKEACDKGGETAKELTAQGACGKAKEIIQEPTKTVEVGVSEKQVRNIVQEEVAKRNLSLTSSQVSTIAAAAASRVPKPKDGKTPTNAQLQPLVSAAVATFCANGKCQGKPGVKGADAPAVTQAQLTATLAAWCEDRNDCVGTDGKPGDQGDKGEPGVGVSSVDAIELKDADGNVVGSTVTFTLTNGSTKSFQVLNGIDGKPGAKGEPGYPFVFVFTVPGALPSDTGTTYSCNVTGPEAADTTCTKQ